MMMAPNKTKYIVPLIVLFAEAIAAILTVIYEYDLDKMLWTLLLVFIIFFIIGDIVRYIYSKIRPTVIPLTAVQNMISMSSADGFDTLESGDDSISVDEMFEDNSTDEADNSNTLDFDSFDPDSFMMDDSDMTSSDTEPEMEEEESFEENEENIEDLNE